MWREFCGFSLLWREFWGISLLASSRPSSLWLLKVLLSALFLKERCFLSPLLLLVEKSPKLCVLTINNLIQSQRFFDFSSSLGLSAAFGSDVRLRSVRKISNLTSRIFLQLKSLNKAMCWCVVGVSCVVYALARMLVFS